MAIQESPVLDKVVGDKVVTKLWEAEKLMGGEKVEAICFYSFNK